MKNAYTYASAACATLFALTATAADPSINVWHSASDLPAEIEKVRERELKRLQKMDKDEDGSVSQEEFASRLKARGRRLAGDMAMGMPDPMRVMSGRSMAGPWPSLVDRRVRVKRLAGEDGADVDVDVEISEQVMEALEESGVDLDAHAPGIARIVRLRADMSEEARDPSRWFDIVDANGDGVLDREEVAGARDRIREDGHNKLFDAQDANKDGVLNEQDVYLRLKKLEALDSDGDGAVSDKEVSEVMRMLSRGGLEEDDHVIMWHREHGDH